MLKTMNTSFRQDLLLNIISIFFFLSCSNLPSSCAFRRIKTSKDNSETEIDIKVNIPGQTLREKRSVGEFPQVLDIELPVYSNHVTVSLRRNNHINHRVPVTVERYGKIIHQHLNDTQNIGYYFDLNNGSAFMVQLSNKQTSESQLEFFGVLAIGKKIYLVQPPDENHRSHSLSEAPEENPVYGDYKEVLPGNERIYQTHKKRTNGRVKRQNTIYEVEILMVIDFSVYSFWKDRSSGATPTEIDANAKKDIRQYFALLLDAIDMRYTSVTGRGYEIRLLFAGLHIADTTESAVWTEPHKNETTDPPQINSDVTLVNFRDWINNNAGSLPENDHAMLFTAYDMERNGSNSVAGYAYVTGLCGPNKVSIQEDKFQETGATIAAHELGHNLNSKHDGDGNECSPDLGYVMKASSGVGSDLTDNRRLWHFSECSQDYFDTFITEMNSAGTNCMLTRSASYNETALDEYQNDLMGQLYTPDDQCQTLVGPGSYMCREQLDFNYTNICAKMSCAGIENNGTCWLKLPWTGTSCGNGQICSAGYCVSSDQAPTAIVETCIFGDQPGEIARVYKTCDELINIEPNHYNCYKYNEQCCGTCANVEENYRHLNDCRYGDKESWCQDLEAHLCYNNDETCCSYCPKIDTGRADCKYGDKASWCSTLEARQCYANNATCCAYCTTFETSIPDCKYGDKASWCSTLEAHQCYANNATCCAYCTTFETGIPGCEYGDHISDCVASSCKNYNEHSRTYLCCHTCAEPTTTSLVPTTSSPASSSTISTSSTANSSTVSSSSSASSSTVSSTVSSSPVSSSTVSYSSTPLSTADSGVSSSSVSTSSSSTFSSNSIDNMSSTMSTSTSGFSSTFMSTVFSATVIESNTAAQSSSESTTKAKTTRTSQRNSSTSKYSITLNAVVSVYLLCVLQILDFE